MNVIVGLPNQESCSRNNCDGRLPFNETLRHYGMDWLPCGFTMVGIARLQNFLAAIIEVHRNNISGSIIELGFGVVVP